MMDRRRSFPWLWVIVIAGLIVVVAVIAYSLGLNHAGVGQPIGFVRPFRLFVGTRGFFGGGVLGFWLPVLLLALVVGVLVAAVARPSQRTETFEEWHRREHQRPPTEGTELPGRSESTAETGDVGRPLG